jgi:speckle-type POZ protein
MSDVVTSGVKEVRLGLFRICWEHLKLTLRRRVPTRTEIKLCGSQLGRSVLISLEVTPNQYQIKVLMQPKDVDKGLIDGKEPSKKHRKLNESLVSEENLENLVQPPKVWIEKAVSVDHIKVSQLHNYNNSWEGYLFHDETEEIKECLLMIWIDFGTNEVRQTHMNKQLVQMLYNQTYCDVQFQFKNGQSIGAHIVILSASSPVFAAMFKPEFKESQTRVVVIEDIDVQVFRHLLDYFYTSEAPRITRNEESSIMLLYEAADKYDVNHLKNECIKMLLMQLDMENAIEMLIWSTNHVIPKLLKAAMKKIVKNCKMLCSQPSWLNFMKNHPELCQEVTKKMAYLVDNSSDSDSSDSEY